MKNLPRVTVGIVAYNEEANIENMLRVVLHQKERSYRLAQIIVVSDGSTDNTITNVLRVSDKRIRLVVGKKRLGLVARLNYLFKNLKTDILVKLDADIIPSSTDLLDLLVTPFLRDPQTGYVAGRLVPVEPKSFLEEAINTTREVWDNLRTELKDGNSVYSCAGAVYALSKKLARKSLFPKSAWSDNVYLFFSCINNGLNFHSVKKAEVIFKPPTTVSDYVAQMNRYVNESKFLQLSFPRELIDRELYIPRGLLYRLKLKAFFSKPVLTSFIFVLNVYAKYFYRRRELWMMIKTTKGGIKK